MRAQLNRLVVGAALLLGLPAIAVAERLRPGWGRVVVATSVRLCARACGVRFEIRGAERLVDVPSCVLVPNHASPLDIAALLVAVPQARFAAAAELFEKPLLAGAMRAVGTVAIDRRRPREARRQLAELSLSSEPMLLIVFPEGGIAPVGSRLPFKTGAFALAIGRQVPVVPVAIHGTADILPPGARLAARRGTVTVEFLQPLATTGITPRGRTALRDRAEGAVLAALALGRDRNTA